MLNCLIVGAGGFLGAVFRYLMSMLPLHEHSVFPFNTLLINVIGAFLIGIITAYAAKGNFDPRILLFLKVGICGGFTTFSTFALEAEGLLGEGHYSLLATYVCGSVLLCIGAVILAKVIVQ